MRLEKYFITIAHTESRGPILKANLNETGAKRRDRFASHTYSTLEAKGERNE